ncbi:hypothetical protein V3C99_015432, partial [Haemonchus contortus]
AEKRSRKFEGENGSSYGRSRRGRTNHSRSPPQLRQRQNHDDFPWYLVLTEQSLHLGGQWRISCMTSRISKEPSTISIYVRSSNRGL